MHNINCNHSSPTFQRRHYQLVADSLNREVLDRKYRRNDQDTEVRSFRSFVVALMDGFEKDNHLFDRSKFIASVWSGAE